MDYFVQTVNNNLSSIYIVRKPAYLSSLSDLIECKKE